ncbi:hypothetical protein ILUMI_08595 [Ignelater luminosus]|uniref:Putative inorganic phosphate cotransporter n=1 Tax=Ignelater luminosus TaxID=2038154 RepID=A0A8K0DAZ4_IGNLU|nr:hypothetical protein ILUMI_08595 [Ignelater luminosus]
MAVTSVEKGNVESGVVQTPVPEIEAPASCIGSRHVQVVMLFLLITLGYGMRVNLSVGIVAMTDPTVNPGMPTYDWDDKPTILSSFFWGYVIPQIGAGQLAKTYGPKWFLAVTMFISSLFTILIPFMAELGSWGVIACRIMQGLAQGFFFPSSHNLLGKWVPPTERARMGTFVYAGGPFGTVLANPTTGWISASSLGWPFAFYIYGAAGLLWCVAWIYLGKNSPSDHKSMDPIERKYIETSLGQVDNKVVPPTPWKSIVSSLPVWAILIAHSGQNWGFSTLLTNIPTYMGKVLGFDIAHNGLLSAGPYFAFWVLSFVFSGITDYVIMNKIVSVAVARKVANSIGLYVPAAALITLGLISDTDSDISDITLVLLFIAVGVNSSCFCGYNVNHIDLSPTHAGTLMGITNGFSNIFSIIAPLLVQFIVSDEENPQQWAVVFYIAAAVSIAGNTFFVFFGSGEIQPWDSIEPNENTIDPPKEKEMEERKHSNGQRY